MYQSAEQWLVREEQRMGRWPLLLLVTLMIQCVSYFLYPGAFPWELDREIRYQTVLALVENPLTTQQVPEPAIRHRLLVPILAWILRLPGPYYIVLLFVGTFLFLLGTLVLLRRRLPWTPAVLTLLLLATTTAVTSTTQWLMIQDTWANAAIVGCLLWRKPVWMMGPLLLLGMLAEERCISTVPLLLFWFHLDEPVAERRQRLITRLVSVAIATVMFAMVYFCLHQLATPVSNITYFGEKDNTGFIKKLLIGDVLRSQLPYIPTGVWNSLRAGWLVVLLWCWYQRRSAWELRWMVLGLLAILGHAVLVTDISRVSGLVFPGLLLAVVQLHERLPRVLNGVLLLCVIANLLAPQYQIIHHYSKLMPPLLLRIL